MKGLPDSVIVYAGIKAARKFDGKKGRNGDFFANLGWDAMDKILKDYEAKKAKTEETK